jgi:hypothetical protein
LATEGTAELGAEVCFEAPALLLNGLAVLLVAAVDRMLGLLCRGTVTFGLLLSQYMEPFVLEATEATEEALHGGFLSKASANILQASAVL